MRIKKLTFTGILISFLFMLPFLILGTESIITYHDQLDGELLSYILSARYLFTDVSFYPEIMNGLPSTGAVAPAPAFVLLYKLCKPFLAFLLSQWIIFLVGFVGMFFLSLEITDRKHPYISFLLAVFFTLLPFYPVYGLCIPGQPLLYYAVLKLSKPTGRKYTKILYSLIVIGYGLCSSLVLCGFGVLLTLSIYTLLQRKNGEAGRAGLLSCFLLLLSYLCTNHTLILQILFPSRSYVSHKTEMILFPQDFKDSFLSAITDGISYAQSFALPTLLFAILTLVYFIIRKKKPGSFFITLLLLPFLISLFYSFYHGSFITGLRNSTDSIFKTFNLDRICWLLPTFIFMLASVSVCSLLDDVSDNKQTVFKQALTLLFLGFWGLSLLWHSPLKPNISRLVKGDSYYALDWNRFFAPELFTEIKETIGRPQEDYRVVSIGIFPAAATYNGFYCLDGYSNNYPVEYKKQFREVIAPELAKSEYLSALYDDWGNRFYIPTAEAPNYYTFEKKWDTTLFDLSLNMEKFKELGGEYLISAAKLANAEALGLSLLREEPFDSERSWYHLYVYRVN